MRDGALIKPYVMHLAALIPYLIISTLAKCGETSNSIVKSIHNAHPHHIMKELCLKDEVVRSADCKVSSPEIYNLGNQNEGIQLAAEFKIKQLQTPCYCHINVCGEYSIPKLFQSCKTGYVHPIKCGGCVRCAVCLTKILKQTKINP